jgi:hypothetical protein
MSSRLLVVLLTTGACAPSAPAGDCSPMNCTGCCDTMGQCKAGIAKDACGSGGFRCLACAANQLCGARSTCELDPNAPASGGSAAGGAAGGAGGGAPGTIEEEYVRAHNTARRRAMPAPNPPLPDVTWDTGAEAFAKLGADRCIFAHRQQNQYGENLYASGGPSTPTSIIESFESEKRDYNYANNSCSRVCGHYTQVVWRTSVKIGCATTRCTTNSPFGGGEWYLTACNYTPQGNWAGQRPY